MSKRKERKNLPKASVERAREEVDTDDRAARRAARREERGSSRRSQPDKPTVTQRNRESGGGGSGALRQALAKPTKFVTEEQLHEEYGYVLADLRNMFILAGALFVLLVILAQFI